MQEGKQVAFRVFLPGYIAFLLLMIGSTVVSWLWPERPGWTHLLGLGLTIAGGVAFTYYASKKRAP
jgi:hypothetical protein